MPTKTSPRRIHGSSGEDGVDPVAATVGAGAGFPSRGVRRTYGASLQDGVLRLWRDDPEFAQRFSATLGPDAFEGVWQVAEAPGDWKDDVKVSYRRR